MNVIGSLIELGIDFVPVPGVKPAFDILNFLWQNVKQASNNRDVLRNLAVSAADILTAVNYVLEENEPNKHARDMLHKLETVLTDISLFAAKHANMNLFKLLIKNVDIDGQIEFFQHRLQNLWVAFNIAALGSIGAEVRLIHQGQLAKSGQLTTHSYTRSGSSKLNIPHNSHSAKIARGSYWVQESITKEPAYQPHPQKPMNTSVEPVMVDVSSSTPYEIKVRGNTPCLSFNGHEEPFHYWGLRTAGVEVTRKSNMFEIIQQRDWKAWKWTLNGKVISVSRHDPSHPRQTDSMDLAFSKGDSAMSWFYWLEVYASSPPAIKALRDPPASALTLRKKFHHSLMRKSVATIDYKRPMRDWEVLLCGHAQSVRDYASQFTYISTSSHGMLPFCTVYRSGDTLVYERSIRADSLEPTFSRRYRFDIENQAQIWYSLWRECAMTKNGDDDPAQVELVTKYECEIQFHNDCPILASKFWPDVILLDWGLPKVKPTESLVATTFKWTYNRDHKISVNAAIPSRPGWFETLEIEFHDTKPASTWFSYLTGYSIGTRNRELLPAFLNGTLNIPAKAPPRPQTASVAITITRICWMAKFEDSIETHTATSDEWVSIFLKSYKKMEDHVSHMSAVARGTSGLPSMRIWMVESFLYMDHRRSVWEGKSEVSRRYKFGSGTEARMWYDIWREHLKKVAPVIIIK